ncbi:hypothetical protein OH686_20445 [Pseudomonas sp. SO81]|nr:hypothetical protein OH686_20445 [Pseudomonas sp. SO81]
MPALVSSVVRRGAPHGFLSPVAERFLLCGGCSSAGANGQRRAAVNPA